MKPSLAVLTAVALLSACAPRPAEAPARVVPRVPSPAPVAPVLVASAPGPASYQYVPSGKRDPFHHEAVFTPPPSRCQRPLCRYSLDELKLTGVISGLARPVAVLESPQGRGYPVSAGSPVGNRGGTVKQVLRDAVVVAELWPDAEGHVRASEVVLRLRPDAPLVLDE